MRKLFLSILGIGLLGFTAFAGPVGTGGGVYINGVSQSSGAAGGMSTNDFANGSGSNNVNKVDHAIYADTAGNAGGIPAFAAMSGSTSNAVPGSPLAGQVSTGLTAYADVIIETNRAIQAEGLLNTAITSEVARATSAETNLQAQVISETNRAIQAESGLNSANTNTQAQLIIETNRAIQAEGLLNTAITSEVARATSAETNLQAQVVNTTNRVAGLEGQTNRINSAYDNSTNALAQIVTETNRAYVAETNLQAQIAGTTNRVKGLESQTNDYAYLARNNTFSVGTTQAFDSATVAVNATAGTQAVNYQTMTNVVGGERGTVNLSSTGTNVINFSKVYNTAQIPIIQTYQNATYLLTYDYLSVTTSNATFLARNSGGLETDTSILVSWTIPAGPNGTLVQADAIYANSISMEFANTNLVQTSGSGMAWNTYTIVNGRVYIGSTNGLSGSQFSQPSQFSIRSDSTLTRDSVLYRWTNVYMYATYMTNAAGAGTNILYLNDASGLAAGGLLYLMDGTPEFVGVTNVVGSAVYLENNTAGAHSSSSGVSLVKEFAAYAYDATSANKVWYAMRFNGAYSISNLTVNIKYKK